MVVCVLSLFKSRNLVQRYGFFVKSVLNGLFSGVVFHEFCDFDFFGFVSI